MVWEGLRDCLMRFWGPVKPRQIKCWSRGRVRRVLSALLLLSTGLRPEACFDMVGLIKELMDRRWLSEPATYRLLKNWWWLSLLPIASARIAWISLQAQHRIHNYQKPKINPRCKCRGFAAKWRTNALCWRTECACYSARWIEQRQRLEMQLWKQRDCRKSDNKTIWDSSIN